MKNFSTFKKNENSTNLVVEPEKKHELKNEKNICVELEEKLMIISTLSEISINMLRDYLNDHELPRS